MTELMLGQIIKERGPIKVNMLASELQTNEDYLLQAIEELEQSGSNIRVKEGAVYLHNKYGILYYFIPVMFIFFIVFIPAIFQLD